MAVSDAQGQDGRQTEHVSPSLTPREPLTSGRKTPSRSTSPRLTRSATTPILSTSKALATSPLPSRENSPIRPNPSTSKSGSTKARSRGNSAEHSPQRLSSHNIAANQSVPSAAAVQRTLASAGDTKLLSPTASQFSADALEPRKSARATTGSAVVTPARLASPPSTRSKPPSQRGVEQQPMPPPASNTSNVKTASGIDTIEEEDDSEAPGLDIRLPGRGGVASKLETVQEDGPTEVPAMSDSILVAQRPSTIQEDPDEDNPDLTSSQTTSGTKSSKTTGESGSGSDDVSSRKSKGKEQARTKESDKPSDAHKSAPASAAASRKPSVTSLAPGKPSIQPRRSFQHLNPARNNKEGSVKSMTVETEVVSNPDLLGEREGRGASGRHDGGSLRAKASTDTIRPKRDKKRVRKAPNIASGAASSKADIFEAKVASAVDEAANSSDSDETFVYESNPPEPRSSHRAHGARYHHSRTPSVASMASQSADNHRSNGVTGKKSMKFINANQLRDPDDEDTAYYPSNTSRSSHRPHHHIARLNRMQQQSAESDSPASSMRSPRAGQFNSWRTQASRNRPESESIMSAMADKPRNASMYDLGHPAGADDEYTPLIGQNGRTDPRLRKGRLLRADSYRRTPMRSCLSCLKLTCVSSLMGMVVALVVLALVLCNRTLFDVRAVRVHNVLVSEQELFIELDVTARNPNIVDISISEGNLDLFAKSKYVGTTEMWRDGTIPGIEPADSNRSRTASIQPRDNVDDGTDPIEEPGAGTHTMLLGRVTDFDSTLHFASSPFTHQLRRSSAGMRLAKPGNKTEEGGSRRWENVMQHPFQLVVEGQILYYLPLSSKVKREFIKASVTITPDKPIDDDGSNGNDTARISAQEPRAEVRILKRWQG